jgi:SAM-dependent methyltransferase
VGDSRLIDTQRAFDGVAGHYDGPTGNNALIQRLRRALWNEVLARAPASGRLLDLGCGTGLDAAFFAAQGFSVVASDWSGEMVARTRARAETLSLTDQLKTHHLGIQELERLRTDPVDLIYSDMGALNCVDRLRPVSESCARLLAPGGWFVASVIGRICPWEVAYYLRHRNPGRALVRFRRGMVPVGLEGETVWTRYFTPRQFYRGFEADFELVDFRGLNLFMVPPYLDRRLEGRPSLTGGLAWLDAKLGDLPLLRSAGDHFLITLRRRAGATR